MSPVTTLLGPGGLSFIDLSGPLAEATVCTQGAQLTLWQPRGATCPVTFSSGAMQYVAGKPLRGGIPLCWPWFGPHPSDPSRPSHGFARNLPWEPVSLRETDDGARELVLVLRDSDATRALWPAAFRLECRISAGATLGVELLTTNTGGEPVTITEALHTYFRVADVAAIEVVGLDGAAYADSADAGVRKRQSGAVSFGGEVDRVFVDTTAACSIIDPLLRRRIHIHKEGSRSTIVWNPGAAKAARLADLGATDDPAGQGGWRQLVCVESANALDDRVTILPGMTHRLAVRYEVEQLQ